MRGDLGHSARTLKNGCAYSQESGLRKYEAAVLGLKYGQGTMTSGIYQPVVDMKTCMDMDLMSYRSTSSKARRSRDLVSKAGDLIDHFARFVKLHFDDNSVSTLTF